MKNITKQIAARVPAGFLSSPVLSAIEAVFEPTGSQYYCAGVVGENHTPVTLGYDVDSDGEVIQLNVWSEVENITRFLTLNQIETLTDKCWANYLEVVAEHNDDAKIAAWADWGSLE